MSSGAGQRRDHGASDDGRPEDHGQSAVPPRAVRAPGPEAGGGVRELPGPARRAIGSAALRAAGVTAGQARARLERPELAQQRGAALVRNVL